HGGRFGIDDGAVGKHGGPSMSRYRTGRRKVTDNRDSPSTGRWHAPLFRDPPPFLRARKDPVPQRRQFPGGWLGPAAVGHVALGDARVDVALVWFPRPEKLSGAAPHRGDARQVHVALGLARSRSVAVEAMGAQNRKDFLLEGDRRERRDFRFDLFRWRGRRFRI